MRLIGLVMLCGATMSAAILPVQAPVAGPGSAQVLEQGFLEVSVWVTKSADLIPADKYGYRPVATVRTVAQQLGHIADAYNYYCRTAVAGKPVPWSDDIANGPADKATITTKLREATTGCAAVYKTSQAPPLMAAIAHTNLHYGNLVTYMRMLGLTPPSS